jgi:hypothetical protein
MWKKLKPPTSNCSSPHGYGLHPLRHLHLED